jgi:hypothetical protein
MAMPAQHGLQKQEGSLDTGQQESQSLRQGRVLPASGTRKQKDIASSILFFCYMQKFLYYIVQSPYPVPIKLRVFPQLLCGYSLPIVLQKETAAAPQGHCGGGGGYSVKCRFGNAQSLTNLRYGLPCIDARVGLRQ